MNQIVPPHGGGVLNPRLVPAVERGELLDRANTLQKVPLTSREVSDVFMLGMGAYSPLSGFMGRDDWHGVCLEMKLSGIKTFTKKVTADAKCIVFEVDLPKGAVDLEAWFVLGNGKRKGAYFVYVDQI